MNHRQNNVLNFDTTPVTAGANYTVNVLPVGAVAVSFTGNTATVDAGHGFAAGDKVLVWDGSAATFVAEALSSVTPTTLVWASATPTISSGDLLCNLGPDTASGATPAYDGFSGEEFIFTDADLKSAITNNKVTCSSTGDYDYYHGGDGRVWELIRDSGGTVAAVVDGFAGSPGRHNICDYGAVGDGATDNALRINAAVNAANGGHVHIPGGPNSDYYAESAIVLTANTKLLGDPDATLYKNFTIATNGVGDGFIYNTNAASASDDNIEIGGFRINLANTAHAGDIIQLWSDNFYVHDLRILDFGATGTGGRAITYRGDNTRIVNVHATSTLDETGNGGILCFGGTGHIVSNCNVQAGDDCYGAWVPTSGSWANIALAGYTLSNCYGSSNAARLFFCGSGVGVFTGSVADVVVQGLNGPAENGLVHVNIPNASSSGTVKNVRVSDCVCDAAQNDEANYAVLVQDTADGGLVSEVHITNCFIRVTAASAAISPAPIYYKNVDYCSFKDSTVDATGQSANQTGVIQAQEGTNIDVCGNTIKCSSTNPSAAWGAIRYGSGTSEIVGGHICNNTIIDTPSGLTANSCGSIFLSEASGVVVSGNRITLGSGKSGSTAIWDAGGTSEGNNVIVGNELIDFWDEPAIFMLQEGDTIYENNLGFNPAGVESYTADTTPAQGDVPLRAQVCIVTTGNEDDSVTLPEAVQGRTITIHNNSSGVDLQIFPASGDNIGDGLNDPMFLAGVGHASFLAVTSVLWVVTSGTLKSTSA